MLIYGPHHLQKKVFVISLDKQILQQKLLYKEANTGITFILVSINQYIGQHTFSTSCKAIQMLVATSTPLGRERLVTAGMHFTALRQASLT